MNEVRVEIVDEATQDIRCQHGVKMGEVTTQLIRVSRGSQAPTRWTGWSDPKRKKSYWDEQREERLRRQANKAHLS